MGMLELLKGKKTYIVSGLIVIVAAAFGFGLISKEQFETIVAVLVGLGGVALRSAMK